MLYIALAVLLAVAKLNGLIAIAWGWVVLVAFIPVIIMVVGLAFAALMVWVLAKFS